MKKNKVCVVIPCYNVKNQIISVLKKIDFKIIDKVIIVDDCCPEKSGEFAKKKFKSKKISYIFLKHNTGVGGATIAGFNSVKKGKYDIVIKLDGDGQHNPEVLKKIIKILSSKLYDFCKGYRTLNLFKKDKMPILRKIGNISLTLISRIITGYYNLKDVTNGLIGLRVAALNSLKLNLIKKNFFFEQDLIFHLTLKKLKLYQIKTETIYKNEKSNLKPIKTILPFLFFHLKNLFFRFK